MSHPSQPASQQWQQAQPPQPRHPQRSRQQRQPAPGWGTQPDSGQQPTHVLPVAEPSPRVRTGPSGMVLGSTARGPVSIRLFRPRPTKLVLAGPQYVSWLLAYRSVSMGAHVSVLPEHARDWQGLVERIRRSNGTADLLGPGSELPGGGRPYRPSLVVSDLTTGPAGAARVGGRPTDTREIAVSGRRGSATELGSWQAMLLPTDLTLSASVQTLRNCDLALIAPTDERVLENMRKAYFLNARQVKAAAQVGSDELLLAMPRRIVKLSVRPTRTEYQVLFG